MKTYNFSVETDDPAVVAKLAAALGNQSVAQANLVETFEPVRLRVTADQISDFIASDARFTVRSVSAIAKHFGVEHAEIRHIVLNDRDFNTHESTRGLGLLVANAN